MTDAPELVENADVHEWEGLVILRLNDEEYAFTESNAVAVGNALADNNGENDD